MDIVLECFDTFFFDHVYASLSPAAPRPSSYDAFNNNGSASGAILKDLPSTQQNNWQYKPASEFLSFTPSTSAYKSSLQRDDPLRQLLSLFCITWCATPFPTVQCAD
jgi:lathosterol oxidase